MVENKLIRKADCYVKHAKRFIQAKHFWSNKHGIMVPGEIHQNKNGDNQLWSGWLTGL